MFGIKRRVPIRSLSVRDVDAISAPHNIVAISANTFVVIIMAITVITKKWKVMLPTIC